MPGGVRLPGQDGLLAGLFKTQDHRFVNQPVQANILGNGLAESVAIEKHVPDQAHSVRIDHLAGMEANGRVSGDLFSVFPQAVMALGRNAQVRVCQLVFVEPGDPLNGGDVQHALAVQVMNQGQRARGCNQWRCGGFCLG